MVARLIAAGGVALVLAGCGGGTHTSTSTVSAAGVQAWRVGFVEWRRTMTSAIDDLSLLFSEQDTVRAIAQGDKRLLARLFVAERKLAACGRKLRALGVTPAGYEEAQSEAVLACRQFEKGAALLLGGVKRLRSGHGVDLFDQLSGPLGTGQALIREARLEFRAAGTG